MNNMSVYIHTSPYGKVYIGITSQDCHKRWSNGNGYKNNAMFWADIKKYGWDNFQHRIIKSRLSDDEACSLEIELIRAYDSTNPEKGYNQSAGGGYGCTIREKNNAERKAAEAEKRAKCAEKEAEYYKNALCLIYQYFFEDNEERLTQTEAEVRAYSAKKTIVRLINGIKGAI